MFCAHKSFGTLRRRRTHARAHLHTRTHTRTCTYTNTHGHIPHLSCTSRYAKHVVKQHNYYRHSVVQTVAEARDRTCSATYDGRSSNAAAVPVVGTAAASGHILCAVVPSVLQAVVMYTVRAFFILTRYTCLFSFPPTLHRAPLLQAYIHTALSYTNTRYFCMCLSLFLSLAHTHTPHTYAHYVDT